MDDLVDVVVMVVVNNKVVVALAGTESTDVLDHSVVLR